MSRITAIARVLLGLGFVVFSLNYFVPFLPANEPPPPEALPFLGAFVSSGFMTLVKVVELGAGLLLLSNRFVPLAATLLAPIIVGIAAFHLLLAPAGMPIVIAFVALELAIAWGYRGAFAPMLRMRATPSVTFAREHDPRAVTLERDAEQDQARAQTGA